MGSYLIFLNRVVNSQITKLSLYDVLNYFSVLEAGGILNSGTILKVIALKHQEEEESSFLVIVTIVLGVCLGAILIAIMTVFICRNRNINPTKTKL